MGDGHEPEKLGIRDRAASVRKASSLRPSGFLGGGSITKRNCRREPSLTTAWARGQLLRPGCGVKDVLSERSHHAISTPCANCWSPPGTTHSDAIYVSGTGGRHHQMTGTRSTPLKGAT